MKILIYSLALALICGFVEKPLSAQKTKAEQLPQIDIKHYKVNATLTPAEHEIKADVQVEFIPLEATNQAVFELNRGLKISKVFDERDRALEIIHEEDKPFLAVKFGNLYRAGEKHLLRFIYEGTFERATAYKSSTAEGFAYIGEEGSYLLYPAKWFPLSAPFSNRATSELHVTVPVGTTVVGIGQPRRVQTKGTSETFTWVSDKETFPNSFVAASLFEKPVEKNHLAMTFYLTENHLKQTDKLAEAIENIVSFYASKFASIPFEPTLKIVEVNDTIRDQAGGAGLILITNKELESPNIPTQALGRKLAYQWWMHYVFPKSPNDLWLADGFAYYSAALYTQEKLGKEAFQNEIDDLATLALKFEGKGPIIKGAELGYGSEAYESVIGGKGGWVLHMLRGLIGDPAFFKLLDTFTKQYALKSASIRDFENKLQEVYGKNLSWFFAEWVNSSGVPDLAVDYTSVKTQKGFKIRGDVKQDLDLFRMPVELEIETKGKKEYTTIDLQGKSSFFELETTNLPLRVKVDPNNKILRNSESLRLAVSISKGRKLFEKGDYVEAIREFHEAIKINPRSSLAHFRLAETFFEQFSLQSAAASLRDALNGDLNPKWIEVWSYINLGKIYDILNQRERARAEYNKAMNTKDDTFGAQAQAKKYFDTPFTKERATSQTP